MTQIQYPNDVTGSLQITHGSDGRLNVSSRSDGRAYYNSRDVGQAFAIPFQDADADAGEFVAYIRNSSTSLTFVVSHIGINSTIAGTFILHKMNSTLGTGTALVPVNENFASPHTAALVALKGSGGVGVAAAGTDAIMDVVQVTTGGHEEFRLADTIRLGQDQSIAIEYDRGASSIVEGTIFGYFE